MEDDPIEDDVPFEGDDDSVATVPILPLFLPQPEPPLTDDEHSKSTDNPRFNTNDDSDANIAAAPDATINDSNDDITAPNAAILADAPPILQ